MKKMTATVLACLLALTLCACGNDQPPVTTGASETTGAPAINAPETTAAPETTQADLKALAMSCEGKEVSELYALIGQPERTDYAPSCLGEGEDGMLFYDGFVVYTYREGESETVDFVE